MKNEDFPIFDNGRTAYLGNWVYLRSKELFMEDFTNELINKFEEVFEIIDKMKNDYNKHGECDMESLFIKIELCKEFIRGYKISNGIKDDRD